MLNSFFRYPGGKAKVSKIIIKALLSLSKDIDEYCEPFFGAGGVGIPFLYFNHHKFKKISLNDKDPGIIALWIAVARYHLQLEKLILSFQPSVKTFSKFKDFLLNEEPDFNSSKDILNHGFRKLAIHQISYSGLGTKAGGPLGGKKQISKYKIDCRWSPKYLIKKINKLNKLFLQIKNLKFTCFDYQDVLKKTKNSLLYIDPPYYIKGTQLYQIGFVIKDHIKLSEILKKSDSKWIISYDDCEEIRSLYSWAAMHELKINYTINGSRNKNELLISSPKNKLVFKDYEEIFPLAFETFAS